LPAPRGSPTE